VFCSVKIAGSGVTRHSHAESKDQNVSNATVLTNPKTIRNLDGVVRQMIRSILQDWKRKKRNHALTHSNAQIAEEIIKQTPTNVHSGDTGSIGNGSKGSILRSVKTGPSQFVWKGMA